MFYIMIKFYKLGKKEGQKTLDKRNESNIGSFKTLLISQLS